MQQEKIVILGSGPAGLTAAIYASRAGLKPLVIDGAIPGGQLMSTTYVENWPGELSILGPNLMENMRKHAIHFGARFLSQDIVNVNLLQNPFELKTNKGLIIEPKALIISTGALSKLLNCPGENQYFAKGVSTCAVCDGPFYKDKNVVIVGGGDTAMENALFMANYASKITIVHILSEFTASKIMKDRVLANPKVNVIYNSTVTEIGGNQNQVTHVVITNQLSKETSNLLTDGVFISIGLNPNTYLFKNQLELDHIGYIKTKNNTKTSINGVFAAGDVCDPHYRQAITSAGSGCMAALDAQRYLELL